MRRVQERLRVAMPIGASLAVLAGLAAWLGWSVGGEAVALWVDDVVTLLAAAVAAALCARAAVRHAGSERRFWWLLAAAAGAWALAEAIWGVYDLLTEDGVPSVSWADAGYLAAMSLAVAALLAHPALRGDGTRKARKTLDGVAMATALLFLSWTFVLGPLWESSDLTTLGGAVAMAYPFGDVVLVFFVVLAVRRMTGADRLSLCCLLGGLLAMAFADSAYAYLTGVEDYESGGVLDVAWVAGYLGIALSAWFADADASGVRRPVEEAPPLAAIVVPFVPVLLALSVLGIRTQTGHRPDDVALVAAFALVALVLVRQALLVWDLRRRRLLVGPAR